MTLVNEYFRPARPWVTGNLQTVASRVRPRRYDLAGPGGEERVVARLADGEGLALRVHRPIATTAGRPRPLVLLVHGMGGNVGSSYVQAMALGLLRAGYVVARVDQRGTGDSREHSTELYHGGRTGDLRDVLRLLAGTDGVDGLALVGWSLGGNLTLKLMGEPLDGLPMRAAASVCAPLDLLNDVDHIGRRMGGLYEKYLMHGLRRETLQSRLELTAAERDQVRRVRSLVEFDTIITARRNGWRDAAEYYEVNSSAQFLPCITVPTLVIHAVDDPLIPATAYRAVDWDVLAASTPVRRAITPHGGHCGFHERGAELPWFVPRILRFLDEVVGAPSASES
jgi:uncharacterized protein